MFRVFNTISYNISAVNIFKQAENIYRVSYSVEITGKIYRINTTHKEKSTVNEEVMLDNKGNIKIPRTLDGRYW